MSAFSKLKKNRSSSFQELSEQLDKMNKGGYDKDDDKYWKLSVDKSGNGMAIIRFLPVSDGDDLAIPMVQMWDHGFQGPGGWYIENSLTTLGKNDPVSEYNSTLWNNGTDAGKEQARKQKRRLNYHANIYVVKDSANPENEGKVFLFKFGRKIYDKLNAAMNPEYADEVPFNPFDLWEGADFKLKARNGDGGYRTYEPSSFDTPGTLGGFSDDKLEEIYNQQYSLKEINDPKNFKSYDELKARLYKVLGLDGGTPDTGPSAMDDDDEEDFKPKFKEKSKPKTEERRAPSMDEDDDDSLEFFKSLAESDD